MSNRDETEKSLHPETQMMSLGYDPFLSEGAVKPPVFLTSTFAFKRAEDGAAFFTALREKDNNQSGLIYSRFNHPNLQIAEDRIAFYEHGESAAVFSSGMSAIATSIIALVKSGDVILRSQPLYGGTETLITNTLTSLGIQTTSFSNGLSLDSLRAGANAAQALGPVRMIFLETPSNPINTLIDFSLVKQVASEIEAQQGHRPVIVCDNTLLGPIYQHPLDYGVDLVLYSLTKYVGGHSDLVAGAAIGEKGIIDVIRAARSAFGTQLDPHSCWMIGRSLETVSLRMARACENAHQLATYLAKHPKVKKLHHPEFITEPDYQRVYQRQCHGAGSTFSFELVGDRTASFAFLNKLRVFKLAVSLGGTESLVCHPRSTTHSAVPEDLLDELEISDSLVRTSIGIEHPDDLIADLDQALKD